MPVYEIAHGNFQLYLFSFFQAFKALGTDALDELKDNPKHLKEILLNHIVEGKRVFYFVVAYVLLIKNWNFNTLKGLLSEQGILYDGHKGNNDGYLTVQA